jgi:hypothetical protein
MPIDEPAMPRTERWLPGTSQGLTGDRFATPEAERRANGLGVAIECDRSTHLNEREASSGDRTPGERAA